ncbi:DNA cytosine methyltransferase [Aestuariimicrobium sp. Y1814]|uniref:DNA cytosine methyltransferase n=1 Tax=Aestuariimicrobium sp. Y1814 TaxID=3418742 RepID=UPI003DA74B80
MAERYTVVDLFAGCGGMSLGLEQAGFTPVFVSELHHHAMETYTRNRQLLPVAKPENQARDILELTQHRDRLLQLTERLRAENGGEVDLLVGGPPCQGFSGIGHRRTFVDLEKKDIPSNHLYREMATFIGALRPKAFVFENVRGLQSARWTKEGRRGEIWTDVQDAFESIRTDDGRGYEIYPKLLFASDYGVPQNRPRLILIGLRSDIAPSFPDKGRWHPPKQGPAPDPIDVLGDLVDDAWPTTAQTLTYPKPATTPFAREMRKPQNGGEPLSKGAELSEQEYSRHSPAVTTRFREIRLTGSIPDNLKTRKFAQRPIPKRWGAAGPTITVASLPDDFVHFAQDRACTVREWARLQTFPDWYEFSGPRTTGGRRRAGDPDADDWTRDVPKYTQIGNAVPVFMAKAIGEHLIGLGVFGH